MFLQYVLSILIHLYTLRTVQCFDLIMIVVSILLPVVTCTILFPGSVTAQRYPDSLPIIGLGYELHRDVDLPWVNLGSRLLPFQRSTGPLSRMG